MALLVAEAARPRLRYDVRRWSTVFPVGRTATSTLSAGTAPALGWLKQPGQAPVWLAVALCLVVAAGAVHAARTGLLRAG
ncbi:hypothetical protein ACFQ9Z_22945 [Streptomyces sp. NPDC056580]|uniref:hypothetical protein n=1 Tax=Streptomyces sp. NPDC056580 TaxID=3345872 RepID=UPI003698A1D7